ncbi:RNA polymerase factor sigma-54 [Ectobacillus ponti]|uniref:RNA polymerase factor sigma-54 n=1 Tax=Ectobacillus ponti TaxID=2961894 RepID=A0AA41XD00_9BACI|nr:RNA polymerase factor sigma-54 [Ectobacillus ponti]
MKASLVQEQTLRLAMTQELRQAITMLQYNAQELTEFLYEQSLANPLIELRSFDREKRGGAYGRSGTAGMEIYKSRPVTLQDHILDQLQYQRLDEQEKRAVVFLARNIDENGYLQESDEELAGMLGGTTDFAGHCRKLLQGLEPAGIGARNLQECLILQLKRLHNSLAQQIIEEHFDSFAKKDWKQLLQHYKCSMEELQQAVDVITSLQPRPGQAFASDEPMYVTPDLLVAKERGEFIVSLNEKYMPKIQMHAEYSAMLGSGEREVASYLSEKYQQVQWIQRSLEQRRRTLLRVMEVILERQQDFFHQGPMFVKPLALKEVAEELELHESTISRATRNKYVQTPHGMFEMKYFFSQSLASGDEEGVATKRVKELIKQLVEGESKKKPLSDQKIADLLGQTYNIAVSRRTVTKYREQLHIPSSSLRKTIG